MPVWWVSEPLMALWLKDIPLSYQPSHGSPVNFQLLFKSSLDSDLYYEMSTTTNMIFNLGENWFSPWRSYLKATTTAGTYKFFNGLGGDVMLTPGSLAYRERMAIGSSSARWGTNLFIQSTSGAQEEFGWKFTGSDGIDRYFLTHKQDPDGSTTTFNWATNGSGVACLMSITDVDNKTTTLTYTNINGSTLLAQVSDPCGHTATLQYDQSTPVVMMPALTNITDAAGLSSSFGYGSSGLTNLVTPYGTTTFTVTLGSNPGVHVNELGVRDHLYVYLSSDSSGKLTNSYAAWVPSTSPYSNTFDTTNSNWGNSFYWGPKQYALLSSDFLAALTNSSYPVANPYYLYGTNYLQARQRHWLMPTNTDPVGQTLSLERAPSPDGVTQGQITWYDYAGKDPANPRLEGTMILPLFKAWLLPSGESRFIRYERNALGGPTGTIETYSDGSGSLQLRTNVMVYGTNNIDLLVLTNAAGVMASSNVFNGYHQVATNYDALSQTTVYTYDGYSRLTSVKTPAGLTTTNLYGTDNYLSQTIDLEIGRTNAYTWINGSIYSHTDERGLTVTNTWDGLNRLVKVAYPDGTYVTNVYDKLDRVRTIDRLGFTNRYEYDGFRRKVRAVDALNRTNLYDYCDCGVLSSITDPLNQTTSFYYDLSGQRVATVYADYFAVTNNYDLMGRVTNVIDSAGGSVTNWLNNQGLVVASSNAFGQVQSVVFNIEDLSASTVDANGVSITNSFDVLDRLATRTYPDGGVEKFGYSARGLVAYTNQLNQTNFYVYDAARRKTYETNANNEITQFKYDASGNLTNLIDGKSQTTTWNYNEYGLVTNKLDAAGNILLVYTYDPNNRLTNRYSISKGNTGYKYDAVGNLTNVSYAVSPNLTLKFDGLNRLTNMVDAAGTTVYGYTTFGALLSEDGPWANDTVSYTYDNGRRRSGLTLLAPNASAWTESYGYDGANRMTNVTSPAGVFAYAYDATRKLQVSKLTLPNTSYITNAFDSVARLTGTYLKNSGNSVLDSYTYAYNAGNQRTNIVRTDGSYVDYAYDNIGQLKTAKGKESGGSTNRLQEQLSYVYDAAGNLNWRTNNALVQAFNVNNLNELTTTTNSGTLTVAGTTTSAATNVTVNTSNAVLYLDNTFARDGFTVTNGNNTYKAIAKDSYGRSDTNSLTVNLPATNTYAYDLNGNLTSDGTRGFDYDDENQLIRVTVTNAFKKEYLYDGKLRLRVRKEFAWQGGAWAQTNELRFVWDGDVIIQERDANNLPKLTFTRGRDLSGSLQGAGGIGGLLAMTESIASNPEHSYYHADGNGNVTMLINSNQLQIAKYLYDPFGNPLSVSGSKGFVNPIWFSSQIYDWDTGFLHYKYRIYIPELHRWLNRDPLGEMYDINFYSFVHNNALLYFDTDGRAQQSYDQGTWDNGYAGVCVPNNGRNPSAIGSTTGIAATTAGIFGMLDPNYDNPAGMTPAASAMQLWCALGHKNPFAPPAVFGAGQNPPPARQPKPQPCPPRPPLLPPWGMGCSICPVNGPIRL